MSSLRQKLLYIATLGTLFFIFYHMVTISIFYNEMKTVSLSKKSIVDRMQNLSSNIWNISAEDNSVSTFSLS